MKESIKKLFAGKKVTVMGLGLLGGALNDAIFLAECGAYLTITDLKSKEQLASSINQLKRLPAYKLIRWRLGRHDLADFKNADMIIQPGNVPMNSVYLAEAKKNNIPVYVSESLFAQYVDPGVTLVGITGTRGKSTVTQLVYEILKSAHDKKSKVFLAGNVKGVSTLALLAKVKAGDVVVLELDSWALHGMGEIKKSPNISVFTNLMRDHQNYYNSMDLYFADKANIFLHQTGEDYLVAGKDVLKLIKNKHKKLASNIVSPDAEVVPKSWKVKLLGEHNRQNIAYAVTVARILDVPEKTIKKAVEDFKGIAGRLEFVREVNGARYYDDTTATTPDGAIAGIRAVASILKKGSGIVLISGGTDKELDYAQYVKFVPPRVKHMILLKGTASDKILSMLPKKVNGSIMVAGSMKEALGRAQSEAKKGDIVLLSPGAASFGLFKNEFDRGEQFVKLVKGLKAVKK